MTLPAHPLTNFETKEYYRNEPRFNGVFTRDNLPNNNNNDNNNNNNNNNNNIKNGAYVINLDEYHDIGNHWVALYVNNKIAIYFDSFGVKKIITNIYRIQAYDSIMCGYFCIGFIHFMFNGKSLTDYER